MRLDKKVRLTHVSRLDGEPEGRTFYAIMGAAVYRVRTG